jgi:hypothetical protein
MHTKCWSENLKGRDHSKDVGLDGKPISEWILRKQGAKGWTGCAWIRMMTTGGLL